MSKRNPIRRGAFGRGLAISLAGARAGGVFALDGAIRKIRGDHAGDDERLRREAQRFARSLGELKGSYVKIGQIFAMLGEHFLPDVLTQALHSLESETAPLAWSVMAPLFETALGSRLDELTVQPEALAAASLAQVHRARVDATGEEIVLKAQYPELADVLDEDFDAVVKMLRLARWIPASREFDGWLATMREQLHAEIDYPRERRMADRLQAAFAADAGIQSQPVRIHVPAYHPRYCSDTVLALDFVPGFRVTSSAVAGLSQRKRNALGRAMLQLFFFEVFDVGLMQVDPNFGNYLISEDGMQLSLLDFGSVIALQPSLQQALVDTIIAGQVGDDAGLLDGLMRLGCLREDSTDYARETFRRFVDHLLEPLRHPDQLPREFLNKSGQYCWGRSELLSRVGRKAAGSATSRDFTMPTGDFALIARKLTGVFTFISVLEAEFNAFDIAEPFIARSR